MGRLSSRVASEKQLYKFVKPEGISNTELNFIYFYKHINQYIFILVAILFQYIIGIRPEYMFLDSNL
jgi:hypothetical protein